LALESLLADKPNYKDAQEMLCSVWYQPAYQLIEDEKYTEARSNLLDFLASHSYCSNVMSLYLQSYVEQATSLITSKSFEPLSNIITEYANLQSVFSADGTYQNTLENLSNLLKNAHQEAIESNTWKEALNYAHLMEPILSGSGLQEDFLLEAYYLPGVALSDQGNYAEAADAFAAIYRLDPDYKDAREALLQSYLAQSEGSQKSDQIEDAIKWLELAVNIAPEYQNCEQKLQSLRATEVITLWINSSSPMILPPLNYHSDTVRDLTFSSNGNLLVSVSFDKNVVVWNTDTWKMRDIFIDHTEKIYAVDLNPDGDKAITGGADLSLRFWDLIKGESIDVINEHKREIVSIAFSPDGKIFASGDMAALIYLWDANGTKRGELQGHEGDVYSLEFSPDGKYLASTGEDGNVIIWNVEKKSIAEKIILGGTSKLLHFSNNGNYLAVLESSAPILRIINTKTYAETKLNLDFVPTSFIWSPDDQYLILAADGLYWITPDGIQVRKMDIGRKTDISAMDMTSDGKMLALGLFDGTILILKPEYK